MIRSPFRGQRRLQRMRAGSRPKPRGRGLFAEPLERRELLSADAATFAHFVMSGTAPSGPAAMTMDVRGSEFHFRHPRILLGLEIQAPSGSTGASSMMMSAHKGASDRLVFQNQHPSGGAAHMILVSVS